MRKSFMSVLVLVVGLSVFLTACGNNNSAGNNSSGGSGSSESDVTLNVVSTFGGTDPAAKVYQEFLDKFQQKYPNITVKDNSATETPAFDTKLQTQWQAGSIPDLTFFFAGQKGKFIRDSGKVVKMKKILDANPKWANDLSKSALNSIKTLSDGVLYTIPTNGYYEGLIVNKKLFKQAGLKLPKTWSDFKKAIQTFHKNGKVIPIAAGMPESFYLIENFILAAGGASCHSKFFKNGIPQCYVDGLNLIKNTYNWGAYPQDTLSSNDQKAQNAYKKGQAAMIIDGSWVAGGLPENIAKVSTVLPMPIPPNSDATYGKSIIAGFSSGWYLSKAAYNDSKKKDAAVKFLKFMSSKEFIKAVVTANGTVPAAKGIHLKTKSPVKQAGYQLVNNAEVLEPASDGVISNKAYTYVRTHVPQVVTGKMSAKQVLQQALQLNKQAKSK